MCEVTGELTQELRLSRTVATPTKLVHTSHCRTPLGLKVVCSSCQHQTMLTCGNTMAVGGEQSHLQKQATSASGRHHHSSSWLCRTQAREIRSNCMTRTEIAKSA